jgi:hypothetical protein
MLVKMNEPQSTGTIVKPNGELAIKPTIQLTSEQARTLRDYKKRILLPLGLREALYCNSCFEGNFSNDGCRAAVTDDFIHIECRCCTRVYHGQTI